MGTLEDEPKSEADMIKHSKEWWVRASTVHSLKEIIDFQTEVIKYMIDVTGYRQEALQVYDILLDWMKHREQGIDKYRDNSFRSIFTGNMAPMQTAFMDIRDDSLKTFLKN
jgi:trimethylamine monooxygenase